MEQLVEQSKQVLMQNYTRLPVLMTRGEGAMLWDASGKRHLDLFAGFGGAILGHCHPALISAAAEQAQKLWHVGNQFYTEPQLEFAQRLNKAAFEGQAFFCHSGAEANEAAVKLARLRGSESNPKRWKIISLNKSFHGRTLAMITATGNAAVKAGFEPLVPGFMQVDGGDYDALVAAIDGETAGILVEPIQGEGGINQYPSAYLPRLRELCDERGLTLIFDEVWTGCGRTGRWFCHQHFGVQPDIMTLGKAVGGGLPVGVMFARPHVAKLFVPGKHGSTLGGNPICMNVSKTLFDVIERENLLEHASRLGERAIAQLRNEPAIQSKVADVRGRGLFLGIELKDEPQKLVERAMERGIVINLTAKKVIRLAPPINISDDQWERGLDLVIEIIAQA
ncbi:MAG TPA: acetylornithine/succinylornithine family transaminase [Tepidisphaeraceae bacterium]|nr:acetylornithine/succinylornithine family transaminase [Tepidisphaeraceae bacterium]